MSRRVAPALAGLVLATALVAVPAATDPAAAAGSAAVLDTSFGGSFSSGNTYTTATGETMDGALTRRTGNETLDAARGLVLHGGRDGVTFVPGTAISGGDVQQPFVMEAEFTPDASQAALGTILSLGGNLYARYNGGSLDYGFSTNQNGTWTDIRRSVPAPAAGTEHVLSIAYEPTPGGATLHAFLDGAQLPDAVSTVGPVTWGGGTTGTQAGFGNEVHPAGLERGFAGSLRRVRLATFTSPFRASDIALQQVTSASKLLRVDFEGHVDAQHDYQVAPGEAASGHLQVTGGRVATPGQLRLDGTGAQIGWDADPLGADPLASGVLVETVVDPTLLHPRQPVVDAFGVATLTALDPHRLRLSAGTAHWTVTLPAAQRRHHVRYQHLALAIEPADGGLTLTVVAGRDSVSGPYRIDAPASTGHAITWLSGATGTVYGVAVTAFTGTAPTDARVLGPLPCLAAKYALAQRLAIMPGECLTSMVAKAAAVRPSQRQLDWQKLQQTAFLHFGMNTFTGAEWGTGTEDPDLFQPTHLDTDQWARTLKAAGFKLAILVVKHHDGFVLYPSRYTTHDVASSSWENGQGDVLGDFVASMHKYGLKAGVYMSPADENQYFDGVYADDSPHVTHTIPTLVPGDDRAAAVADGSLPTFHLTADDYGAYMLNQLYEVLTQYGPIDEVWFDGAQGRIPSDKVEKYDFASWYQLIRDLAPHAVIAVSGPDVRWVGNESGVARTNEWSVLPTVTGSGGAPSPALGSSSPDLGSRSALLAGRDAGATQLSWSPAECDVSIHSGWFWHPGQQPKTPAQLSNIYYNCVGHNGVLLLNVPPNQDGVISDYDVTALQQWRDRLAEDMPTDLALGARARSDGAHAGAVVDGRDGTDWVTRGANTGTVTLTLPTVTSIDRVALAEDISHGQQLEDAVLQAQRADGSWATIATVGAVGNLRIIALDAPVRTQRVRLAIEQSRAAVHLDRISLYRAAG